LLYLTLLLNEHKDQSGIKVAKNHLENAVIHCW